MNQTFALKLTGAIGMEGELVRAGSIVHVDEATAKNLLHRGKAVVATDADNPLAGASDEAPMNATVVVGDQSVDVQVVGQDADGTPVVTDASGTAIEAAMAEAAPAGASDEAPAPAPAAKTGKGSKSK